MLRPKGTEFRVSMFQPPPSVVVVYDFEELALEPAEILPVVDHLLDEAVTHLDGCIAPLLEWRLTSLLMVNSGLRNQT